MASGRSLSHKIKQGRSAAGVKLEFIPLVGTIKRWKRDLTAGAKRVKGKGNSRQSYLSSLQLPRFGRINFHIQTRLVYIVSFSILLLIAVGIFYKYFSISPHTSNLSNNETRPVWGSTMSVMLAGYDERDGYKYIDFLGVLQLSRNPDAKHKLLVIDVEIATNSITSKQFIKYRNAFNNAELLDRQPVDILRKSLEDLAGIPIDRYALIRTPDLLTYLNTLGVQYVATDNVSDQDVGIVKAGDPLAGPELIKYLASEKQGLDARALRLSKFGQQFLTRLNVLTGLQVFIYSDQLVNLLETNLTREELVNIVWTLIQRSDTQIGYLRNSELFYVNERNNGFYAPDVVRTAERMRSIFARSEVQREQGRIEIYNATNTSGLASKIRRLLDTQGANVVRTGNATEITEKSKLYVPDVEKYTNNVLLIRELLRGNVIIVDEEFPLNHTAELVLVLGSDATGI